MKTRRGGYKGTATFDFYIERAQNPWTKQYCLVDAPEVQEDWPLVDLTLEVTGSAYFEPGVTWRLPEDCYPDEWDEEITSITLNGEDWSDHVTKKERSRMIEQLVEKVKEGGE